MLRQPPTFQYTYRRQICVGIGKRGKNKHTHPYEVFSSFILVKAFLANANGLLPIKLPHTHSLVELLNIAFTLTLGLLVYQYIFTCL